MSDAETHPHTGSVLISGFTCLAFAVWVTEASLFDVFYSVVDICAFALVRVDANSKEKCYKPLGCTPERVCSASSGPLVVSCQRQVLNRTSALEVGYK